MDTAVFNSDPMLKLLTEALRRGPGSPEWHRAVNDLRDVASPEADEYRMLIAARERLESGRAYREVRAGPAFTRELFGQIEAGPAAPSRLSIGLIVRLACLLLLVAAIGVVIMLLTQARPGDAQQLSGRLFVTPVRSWTFTAMPSDLQAVGTLPLETRGGALRTGGREMSTASGVVLTSAEPLDLGRGTCVEMRLDFRPGQTSLQLALVRAVADAGPLATLGPELAIVCDTTGVRLATATAGGASRSLSAGPHVLRIKVAGDAAVAEVDGQTIWSGPQPLGARGFVATRFVRNGRGGDVAVQSLKVLAP